MTFFLLLVSIAVLEYILRTQPAVNGNRQNEKDQQEILAGPESIAKDAVQGLMALGQAIEKEGSGAQPGSAEEQHLKPSDRV